MTVTHFSHVRRAAQRQSLGHRLDEMARRVSATIRDWHQRSLGRRELARLDDHMLRDLGISRAEAVYLSNKPFWKE